MENVRYAHGLIGLLSSLAGTSDATQPLPRPGFLPTYTSPPSGDGDALASAVLAHLGGATPILASAAMANSGPSPLLEELQDLPGFATVPPKLIRRLCRGEFTEMWEILPESWRAEAMIGSCCHSCRPRRGPITDSTVWFAAILVASHPSKAPHFFTYLRTIVRSSRNYDGGAWDTYDAAYRRQAANCNNWNWSHVDAPLFSDTFAGRARVIPRCRLCSGDTHGSPDCPYAPDDGRPPLDNRTLRCLGWSSAVARPATVAPRPLGSDKVCRLFNQAGGSKCRFRFCRYKHVCAHCTDPHPASECVGLMNRPRSLSSSRPTRGPGAST